MNLNEPKSFSSSSLGIVLLKLIMPCITCCCILCWGLGAGIANFPMEASESGSDSSEAGQHWWTSGLKDGSAAPSLSFCMGGICGSAASEECLEAAANDLRGI
eukprot:Skav217736  [mRNA]  locus=scaffold2847:12203:16030:+ [translate_table: standard]